MWGFTIGTKVSELKAKDNNLTFTMNGQNVNDSDIIKTGMVIDTGEKKYNIIVFGDLTGDGKINSADLLKTRQYLLGKTSLEGPYFEAGKITSDKINSATLLKLRRYLLGKESLSQG